MLKDAMEDNIKSLEQKLVKGMTADEAKLEVDKLLFSLKIVIDDEKRATFHALASSIQNTISPDNFK
ncbi:hypothetical protein [Poseidonibacter ostreae]|uniref:Uncharacterized protein n=1 Tax=Poseidonibacter ostreae TaxID=2654171 RepID=A0A6L4WXF6_9BACT|nr:hypothetical protein [Poseidonibacter ostreae]KAB7891443.1 hypothetical protein GBG19_00980 [Poseidonibacter ostreae]